MKKFIILIIVFFLIIPLYLALRYEFKDYSEFKNIQIENYETGIYYRDGKNKAANIFDVYHNSYVSLKEMPSVLKNGVIAMEDKEFYKHNGINIKRTFLSFFQNMFMTGRRGGSTITQQVVKNIRNIERNSIFTKINELMDAVYFEKLYSKDKILEIYLNIFYVAENSRGISSAAHYYFNKDVNELNVNEIAFIIASLQNPARINLFKFHTELEKEKKTRLYFDKKNTVLSVLYKNHIIDKKTYQINKIQHVDFVYGKIKSNQVHLQ